MTWQTNREKSMHIAAANLPNGKRELVSLTNEEILIRCPNESTMLRVLPTGVTVNVEQLNRVLPTGVTVNVEQLNRLQIDRGGGKLSLGSNVLATDVINVF
ncbi:unnamed protein product [Strongylus vulgaris]|uniref:Uncharacterized protein n=1 Tax=Strongylus vulgaris TaxID=40348 RepID=A0A3P7JF97_STRVU|nr:unnamed protein product [Strongylus vulgaris]